MKKLLALIAVLTMVAVWTPANAAPFLMCDCSVPTDQVTGARLQFGTAAWIDIPVATSCGTTTPVTCAGDSRLICYDLASLPSGSVTVKGRFKSVWGESADSLPFSFTKGLPGTSTSTRIVP